MEYGKKIMVGGFHALKVKKDEMSFIKVSSIMGNWAVEYREDTLMYHCLDADGMMDGDTGRALGAVIVNAFMASTIVDAEFQHDIVDAAGRLQERMNASAEPVSEEEDAEILNQMRTEHEMMEELVNGASDGEEGGKTEAEV